MGRRCLAELPRPDRSRLVGPAASPGGRRPHLRRARGEHRRVRRARRGPDGQELVRRRGGGHQGAPRASERAPQRRFGLRRLPRDAVVVPEGVLEVLRELERADEELGAALAELDRLTAELGSIRAETAELEAFTARLPAERNRLAGELGRAQDEASAARGALAEADESVRRAHSENAQEAQRFQVRARDRLSVAERLVGEAASAGEKLERTASEAEDRRDDLYMHARKLAGELRERPGLAADAGKEPGSALAGIQAWSETARAALFVGQGQLAAERDGVIRQANELGAVVLGEPLSSLGTGPLARRVEQGLAGDT